MDVREKEVEAIRAQAQALSQEDANTTEVDGTFRAVEEKFQGLRGPLQDRCARLLASKEEHQLNRDLEDEIVSAGAPGEGGSGARLWVCSRTGRGLRGLGVGGQGPCVQLGCPRPRGQGDRARESWLWPLHHTLFPELERTQAPRSDLADLTALPELGEDPGVPARSCSLLSPLTPTPLQEPGGDPGVHPPLLSPPSPLPRAWRGNPGLLGV